MMSQHQDFEHPTRWCAAVSGLLVLATDAGFLQMHIVDRLGARELRGRILLKLERNEEAEQLYRCCCFVSMS